jgi:adenine phosphoribosyltransferase
MAAGKGATKDGLTRPRPYAPQSSAAALGAPVGSQVAHLRDLIRDVPDFPSPGILFKDITPLLADSQALAIAVAGLAADARRLEVDYVIGAEARGFLLGPALALALGAGFVLARKPGKLPHETVQVSYALEYGEDGLELHADAFARGKRVLVHDDLLATGGTAAALCELVEAAGAEVAGCGFLVELEHLGGRRRLEGRRVHALITYDEA